MRTPGKDIFFIGFLNEWPVGLKTFLPVVGVVFLCLFRSWLCDFRDAGRSGRWTVSR